MSFALIAWYCVVEKGTGWLHEVLLRREDGLELHLRDDTDYVEAFSNRTISALEVATEWRRYEMGTSTFGLGLDKALENPAISSRADLLQYRAWEGTGEALCKVS